MTDPTTIALEAEAREHVVTRSLWADAFHTLVRRPDVVASAVVALLFVLVAAFPRLFTSADPSACDIGQAKIRPQWFGEQHPFGTDLFGCDYFAMTIYGARPSLLLAFVVVGVSVVIGLVLGSLAGYYLGAVDAIISRILEIFLVLPFLLAAMLVLTLFRGVNLGGSQLMAMLPAAIVLSLFGWIGYTRYVRASVLETRNLQFVAAAKALGASDRRVIFRHVLPNAIAPITALIPTSVGGIIATEAVLSFLGIGVRPPAVSWGIMISNGAPWAQGGYPHLLLFPLGCLIATILAFVVIGDALRDALDPTLH